MQNNPHPSRHYAAVEQSFRRLKFIVALLPVGLVILPLVGMVGFAIADNAGLCLGQLRFLPEREIIESAVTALVRSGRGDAKLIDVRLRRDGMGDLLPMRKAQYNSAADFLRTHPACCRINPGERPVPFPNVKTDDRVTIVTVDFPAWRVERGYEDEEMTVRTNVAVDVCGRVRGRFHFRRLAPEL